MIRISTITWARGIILALALLLAAGLAHAVPTTFTVDNTRDAGSGTLRDAITDANANPGADTIEFDIPAAFAPGCNATSGVCTISPFPVALPDITEAVTINGYTQPGASANTLAAGNDAALKIELNGTIAAPGSHGITLTGTNSVVKGLIINRWDRSGVRVVGTVASGNRIEGNYIGTDTTGTQDLGNDDLGVEIFNAPNNVVGGTAAAARNLISGNGTFGVAVFGTVATSGNRIEGNFIGTDATGTADLGNSSHGVVVIGADNVVGGPTAGARNLVSGNGGSGILVDGADATGNRILRNSIFDNGGLGIDLVGGTENANGVNANDAGDPDTGPNRLQNYPVITSATTSSGTTTVQGFLKSSADDFFTLQFFSSAAADPSGFGEGETFAGQTNVTTTSSGNAVFSFTTAAPVAGGRVVTATATNDFTDDTSEFSRAVEVEANTPPPPQCSDGLDNDADGQTDFPDDPGCESATDNSESPDPPPPPPPVANNDSYNVLEDATLTVSPPGVLSNDTGGAGPLSVASPRPASGPSSGTLTLDANGSFVYKPNPNFTGTDSFTYKATDGTNESSAATVNITVSAMADDCTIRGTDGADILLGTPGNDVICALGGADEADGGGGNDIVRGGTGIDDLSGGLGSDSLYGEGGSDTLDAIDGVTKNDLADGGSGVDTCSADKKDKKVSCP